MTIFSTLLSYLSSHPQPLKSPATSLHLSQHAPMILASSQSTADTQETWLLYEQLLLSCLRTSNDDEARLFLQRLSDRFGVNTPRIKALTGIYDEATARNSKELEEVLRRYEETLEDDATNMPIEKRRIAVLQSLNRPEDAIKALTELLDHSPNDAESWAQLSALYFSQGLYAQSIFCLEEVILILPNAYNIFARLGEISYVSGFTNIDTLTESMRYFARSVELCEWYLRGWYGLKLVTGKILEHAKCPTGAEKKKIEGLNELATKRLLEIVGKARRKEKGWEGYDEAEVEAAGVLVKAGDVLR
ncbi:Inositol phosphatase SIW14 [Rhizina undulata]